MANNTQRQLAREIARVIKNAPETAKLIREFSNDGELLTNLGFADAPIEISRWEHFKALFTFKK